MNNEQWSTFPKIATTAYLFTIWNGNNKFGIFGVLDKYLNFKISFS